MFPASPSARAIAAIATRLAADKSSEAQPVDGGLKLMWQRLFRDAQATDAQAARI
jgi:hypothetical protein